MNPTLTFEGIMMTATFWGRAIVVHDNRKGNYDIKNNVDQKHQESLGYSDQKHKKSHHYSNQKHEKSHHYSDEKFAELKDINLETENLAFSAQSAR